MAELVKYDEALPLNDNITKATSSSGNQVDYGTAEGQTKWAWDHDTLTACICDSSWPVGLERGEIQQSEWFGPDCSLRHCPSGDDPTTPYVNETEGEGVVAAGGRGIGLAGNALHVDCSNLGICNHGDGEYQTDELFFIFDDMVGAA
jgi:hypothetical protein